MPESKRPPEGARRVELHPLVEAIAGDPSRPPTKTVKLFGYPGRSTDDASTRLWLDLELTSHVDVPNEAILHSQTLPDDGGTILWVSTDAKLTHSQSTEVQADFLSGSISSGFMGQATDASAWLPGMGPNPAGFGWPGGAGSPPSVLGCPSLVTCPVPTIVACPPPSFVACPPPSFVSCPPPPSTFCPTHLVCPPPSFLHCPSVVTCPPPPSTFCPTHVTCPPPSFLHCPSIVLVCPPPTAFLSCPSRLCPSVGTPCQSIPACPSAICPPQSLACGPGGNPGGIQW